MNDSSPVKLLQRIEYFIMESNDAYDPGLRSDRSW